MNTALEGGEGSASRPGPPFTPGKDTLSIVHEVGWAQGPVWTGAENLAPTGIRSPDRPAPSQSHIPTTLPGPLAVCLTLRLLISYIYGALILDVSRSHTTTHHSR